MDNELSLFGGDALEAPAASFTLLPVDEQLAFAGNGGDIVLPAANDTPAYYYSDGEIIEQHWHGIFIFLAYVTAFIGSYGAIRLLEHALWRSEKEQENASSKFTMHLQGNGRH